MITHSMVIDNDGYLREDDPTTWDNFVYMLEGYGYMHFIFTPNNDLVLTIDDDDITRILECYPNLCEEADINFICLTSSRRLKEHAWAAIRPFSYSEGDNQ